MTDQAPDTEWPSNYFNYFTEIEEHFQRARGTGLFLLSPLDWALIEGWKNSDVPLEAVLQGIDSAFEKWRSRKVRIRGVNSLAYCAQAVAEAAQRAPSRDGEQRGASPPPFNAIELKEHVERCAAAIRSGRQEPLLLEIASSLETVPLENIEQLERRLSALEDKLVAAARTLQSDEDLYAIRESLDRELRPYRGKMTADQLSMLERRYLDAAILERTKLPRLSLFYLR
ncbi:MAG TPA: hypothetical protein VH351_22485 [Bryobacteraceae bacterium]|jgi:hypothetical protein|nr:hypothetical protein [Bryobacteraceae bacterium]